jgi:ribosomal protein S24E
VYNLSEERLTYFILTRKIFDSAIWRDEPHTLKLFIYLIGHARHSKDPKKYNSFEIKRGELVTSLSIIAEDNEYIQFGKLQKWSRAKVSRMLETLKQQNYIEIISDTYGTHIKVCKYDTYQDPNTYKSDTTETQLKRACNGSETGSSINNHDNPVNNAKNPDHGFLPSKSSKKNFKIVEHYKTDDIKIYFKRDVNEKDLVQFNRLATIYGKDVLEKLIELRIEKNSGSVSKIFDSRKIFGMNSEETKSLFKNAKMELVAEKAIAEAKKNVIQPSEFPSFDDLLGENRTEEEKLKAYEKFPSYRKVSSN